ncbi:MAG: sugar phosphate isomerase/epimerase [Acidobacteria bacterium]|nr:sugar phosphate isomerase/epimerase [Acidobacteriota bacterium]MBI3264201.1 sugar phosphate isomerase/epimerase [Acidobacteriota bacterium]
MRFGISTHLYHRQRLRREHLAEIASHGFEVVELFALKGHFDYHDPGAIAALKGWLAETGLALHSIHAPIFDTLKEGEPRRMFSNAHRHDSERTLALEETERALGVAREIPTGYLVVHLGVPASVQSDPNDNDMAVAQKSLEAIDALAQPLGIRVAAEVVPNNLSGAARLVRVLEEEVELPRAGVCLDFGHAHVMGDLIDAIDVISGHLITTHVHDNFGKTDDHLLPFDGNIDWPAALMSVQKIGYDDTLLFELANTSTPGAVLAGAARARRRFEEILAR